MIYCGVLLGPRLRLNNRGYCCGHQPEALRGALLVFGDFNTGLAAPEAWVQDKDIVTTMA